MWKNRKSYPIVLFLLLVFLPFNMAQAAVSQYVYRASTEIKSELPEVTTGAQSGAFIFEQDIVIPPGRNGLQPDLKLRYNNQDEDQSNIAGYGWSFSIPYIQRLPKKGVDRLYDENYFYSSLSGEIVPISLTDGVNGQYGAKVETGNFLNYALTNNKWVVTDKTGAVYTFGKDSSARQDDANNIDHAYKWLLQEVRDTNDNYIKYEYFKNNGQIYPERIIYTGHGVVDGIFEVIFNREARADTSVMYNAGFKIRTQYRISNLTVKANGEWVRKYDFSYIAGDNGKRSLLSGIVESGNKDGNIITLPPTAFTYQQKEKGWTFDGYYAPNWGTWASYQDKGQRIADVTGDGLLDLFSSDDANSNGTLINKLSFINNGNGGYTNGGGSPTPITMGGHDDGVRLGDVNGDGMLDFVYGKIDDTVYKPTKVFIKKIGQNNWVMDENYQSPAWFITASPTNGILDNCVRLADINGDGLADVLKYTPWIKNIYINKGDGNWESNSEYSIPPSYYMCSQMNNPYETVMMDVNGDGLEDFIYSGSVTVSDSSTQILPKASTCLNVDGGKNYDCSYSLDAQYTPDTPYLGGGLPNTYDGANVFLDINGDGLVDFARGQGLKPNDPLVVYINKGDGTGWAYDSTQTLPTSLLTDQGGGDWKDNGWRIIDVNGDGLSDFLRLGGEGGNGVYLNKGQKADLLIRVDHSKSAITEVTYKTAQMLKKTDGKPANPKLPFMVYVADKITTDDGLGNKATTSYQYEGGKYYFNNYLDKRFAGFQIVSKTDALGNVTKQYFHQGDETDSALGEYADQPAKINLMYREDLLDNSGQLQTQTLNKFGLADLGNNRSFVFNSETIKKSYDSAGAEKSSAESFEYNNTNGNLTKKTEWGEVSTPNIGVFTDVGADARIQTYSYATNAAKIIGLPSQETVADSSGAKIRETISYYDNLPFGQASVGNKTKERNWISGNQYADNQKTYNNFGLAMKSYDGNNNLTTMTYDSVNLYPATVVNPLGQTVKYQYDYAVGKPKQTIDANNYAYETAFDPLGRVKQKRIPDASNPTTLVVSAEYFYTDNANPRVIQTKKYLDNDNAVDSYSYLNGLDKTIQERTEAENNFSVKDFAYNKLGMVQAETLAYSSVGSAQTSPTTNTNLFTYYTYDALKRVKTITNAVGATSNNYSNWKVSTTDVKGNTKDYYNDAFGRLIQVVEKITNPAPTNYNTLSRIIMIHSIEKPPKTARHKPELK
ncbi:MAG: VCBS repeat-containing protein [Candidatus Magasanikbacteria bacterium]|nr:VCBS repeat-containing protein [Candidatus Magasanikbacteria bacterium]